MSCSISVAATILKDCDAYHSYGDRGIVILETKIYPVRLSDKPKNAKEYIAQKKAKSAKQRHVNKPRKLV